MDATKENLHVGYFIQHGKFYPDKAPLKPLASTDACEPFAEVDLTSAQKLLNYADARQNARQAAVAVGLTVRYKFFRDTAIACGGLGLDRKHPESEYIRYPTRTSFSELCEVLLQKHGLRPPSSPSASPAAVQVQGVGPDPALVILCDSDGQPLTHMMDTRLSDAHVKTGELFYVIVLARKVQAVDQVKEHT